jgi:phosphoglycerol transferase
MDIALINSWPNLANSAEKEFIQRFRRAAENLGHRAFAVVTSDDIEACNPDFVIALDEISPKLTRFPTFGAMWTPPLLYHGEPRRTRSILSYDGYLVGSEPVRAHLKDLEFSLGIVKPKSDFLFLPTASFEDFRNFERSHRKLAIRVADGDDHPAPDLAAALQAARLIGYEGGPPPSDSGLYALCLHTDAQREADLPSSWLFQAASVGAVIITDQLPFARRALGDAALFIDTTASLANVVGQVKRHLLWLNEDPGRGERLAAEARALLQGRFDLETVLAQCCAFACTAIEGAKRSRLDAVRALQNVGPVALRQTAQSSPRAEAYLPERPLVDVVVRVGERPPEVINRALRSIALQDSGRYRAILVDYKGDKELKTFADGFQAKNMVVTYVRSSDTGYRSTALWAGLARVEAPFFAVLDDDDSVAPDHFPSLIELASRYPTSGFFYAGTIRVEDEGGVSPPNLMGPLELQYREHRELKFLEPYDLSRLLIFDNYITSNSFIGRAELLNEGILVDPQLEVGEDVYLLLLLASQTEFRSSFRPTAMWHWRSVSRDQSMLVVDSERWRRAAAKLALRLAYVPLPATMTLSRVVQPPFVLELGEATAFDPEVVARSQGGALNSGEPAGVWTSATRSFLRLLLSDFIQNGRVFLEFAASGASPAATQNVRISIDDQPIYCGVVRPWVLMRVEQPFRFARSRNVAILRVECDSTFSPRQAGEEAVKGRQLGVLLSKILIEREDQRRRRPEWVCAFVRFLRRRRISAPTA